MQTNKGFTLIELLVVIAIIGILAGMVILNLNEIPNQAKDVKIQNFLDQIRTSASVWYNSQGTYVGFDTSDTNGTNLKTEILAMPTAYQSSSTASAYCASAALVSNSAVYFCIDSTGFSGTTTASFCTTTSIACE